MTERLLLDTHIWIWMQEDTPGMDRRVDKRIDRARPLGNAYVSAVSVWEIGDLTANQRLRLKLPLSDWLALAFGPGLLQALPLDVRIAMECAQLPGNLHRDPADRMLAATARVHDLTLVTHDERLIDYGRLGFMKVLPA